MPPGYSTTASVATASGNCYIIKYVAPCTERIIAGTSRGRINVSTLAAGSTVTISVYSWDYSGSPATGGSAVGYEGGTLLGSTKTMSAATAGQKSEIFTKSFIMAQGQTYWISAFVTGGSPSFTGITLGNLSSSLLGAYEVEMANLGGQFVVPPSVSAAAYTSAVPLMAISIHG